jgi:hypothetical protein
LRYELLPAEYLVGGHQHVRAVLPREAFEQLRYAGRGQAWHDAMVSTARAVPFVGVQHHVTPSF